jgi:acyl-phosphate glycerol 3-phosphate acyltransferase
MLTEDTLAIIGTLAAAFALGSIPFGWIIAKLWGVEDLRKVGSSNVGATNVVRTAGWVPGALTFALDFLKGLIPVLYFQNPSLSIWIGLAAVAGHCFSPLLLFRGGKGVSTTLGAIIALNPVLGGISIAVYILVLAITRVSALGSLFAMLTIFCGTMIYSDATSIKIGTLLIVGIVLARHHENWNQLLKNTTLLLAFLVMSRLIPSYSAVASAGDTLVDSRGKQVTTGATPNRIAALIPSLAEAVVDLDGAAKLVAAPEYTRLPEKHRPNVKSIGPYSHISVEALYSSHPDLVLASMDGNEESQVKQIEKMGLRVVTVNTQTLADITRSLEIVAAAIGSPHHPKIDQMRAVLKPTAKKKATPPKVFIQVGWDPLVTASHATFIHELVALAGGKNVFENSSTKYPRPNPEEVLARDPDVLVICQLTTKGEEVERAQEFWSRFKKLAAIQNHRVYVIPGDWITKPNFELVRGLEELRKVL